MQVWGNGVADAASIAGGQALKVGQAQSAVMLTSLSHALAHMQCEYTLVSLVRLTHQCGRHVLAACGGSTQRRITPQIVRNTVVRVLVNLGRKQVGFRIP